MSTEIYDEKDNSKENNKESPLIENSESNLAIENNLREKEDDIDKNNNFNDQTIESIKSNSFIINRKIRWLIFSLFIALNLLMNFDHGTVPAATEQLRNYLDLDDSELGLFGSLVFLGVIIGSLISLTIINTFNRKYILMACLILCGLSLFLFTKTKQYILLCIDRVIIGIFQAFISIYLPLWCDQFGVERRKTLMLALIQVVGPLGVLVGYIVTTLLNMYLNWLPYIGDIEKDERWLYSFYIQSILIWGISISFIFFPNKYFNSKTRRVPIIFEEILNKSEKDKNQDFLKRSFFYNGNQNYQESKNDKNNTGNDLENSDTKKDEEQKNNNPDYMNEEDQNENEKTQINNKEIPFCTKLKLIFSEPLFIFNVLTMSILYFIVTCVQYWSSDYMLVALEITDEKLRLFAFSFVCLTSPTVGLITGGFIVDKLGGYHKKSFFCLIFSLLSIIPAIPIPLIDSIYIYTALLWVLLFFGASLIPSTQGIIIACLPKDVQGSGNSFSIFFFNLLGYFPAPFVYGFIKDYFDDKNDVKHGSRVAQRVCIWSTIGVCITIAISTIIRYSKAKEYDEKMGRDKSKINPENISNKDENNNTDEEAIRPRESSLAYNAKEHQKIVEKVLEEENKYNNDNIDNNKDNQVDNEGKENNTKVVLNENEKKDDNDDNMDKNNEQNNNEEFFDVNENNKPK